MSVPRSTSVPLASTSYERLQPMGRVVVTDIPNYDKLFVSNNLLYVASGIREVLRHEEQTLEALKPPLKHLVFGFYFPAGTQDTQIVRILGDDILTPWHTLIPPVFEMLQVQQGGGPGMLDHLCVMKIFTPDGNVLRLRWFQEWNKWHVTKSPFGAHGVEGEERVGVFFLKIIHTK